MKILKVAERLEVQGLLEEVSEGHWEAENPRGRYILRKVKARPNIPYACLTLPDGTQFVEFESGRIYECLGQECREWLIEANPMCQDQDRDEILQERQEAWQI